MQLENLNVSTISIEVAQASGFAMCSPFGERHGSYEMVFVKNDAVHRFLVLGVNAQPGGNYLMELYIIAEDAKHSQRELHASLEVEGSGLEAYIESPDYRHALKDAFAAAERLTPTAIKRNLLYTQHPPAAFSAAL